MNSNQEKPATKSPKALATEPMKSNIYQKLLKVQEEVQPIKKTEDNPFFKSKYFDVNGILSALKPILTKHGLVLTQGIEAVDGRNILTTSVNNTESVDSIVSTVYLPDVIDPQKFGSAVTYYRRYALQSLFALEAADDDGNAAAEDAKFQPRKTFGDKASHPDQWNGKHRDVGRDDAENDVVQL